MNTETLLALIQSLAENNGDFLTFSTTTNITTNNSIISTTLNQYDDGRDGFFDGWWVYLNTANNAGVLRKTGLPGTTTYDKTTGTLTVLGAALAAESAAQTCYLFRYNRNRYKEAVIEACKQIYPALYKGVDDHTLTTGNILPDNSFEAWSSSSAMTWYTATSGTFTRSTSAMHGQYAAQYTAGQADDFFYVDSSTYPRLLDLQGKSVSFYCSANAQTADDAWIRIRTWSNDGTTTQTLKSTTSNPASNTVILKLENQSINDNLTKISFDFGVETNGQYVLFDCAHVSGLDVEEHLLPPALVGGHVSQVKVQQSGHLSPPCYDWNCFNQTYPGKDTPFHLINNGTNTYIRLDEAQSSGKRIRLTGYAPLETLSADTDTITVDAQRVPLLIALAKYIFLKRQLVPVSADDVARVQNIIAQAYVDYKMGLMKHRMASPIELI